MGGWSMNSAWDPSSKMPNAAKGSIQTHAKGMEKGERKMEKK